MIEEVKNILNEIESLEEMVSKSVLDENYLSNYDPYKKLDFISECYKTKMALENKLEESYSNLTEEQSLEMLQEINIRRLDKKTQVQLRKIMIAISMAKAANDPLYIKYKKGVMLRKTMKEMILRKYGPRAYQQALSELNK